MEHTASDSIGGCMNSLSAIPEWLGGAAVGAIIAALGYVAKMMIEGIAAFRRDRNSRRASVVHLQSLLRASRVSFVIQNELAQRLLADIQRNHPEVATAGGYESAISNAYDKLSREERELHAVIRGYTTAALRPTNMEILQWVKSDSYFKAQHSRAGTVGEFARKLGDLEAHLLLWHAKYEAWIPDQPYHALVYLADEQRHGLEFPPSFDNTVKQLVSAQ
jgi:hypothetical protein